LLDFPQTITLCAGMSASILITFIPEEKVKKKKKKKKNKKKN